MAGIDEALERLVTDPEFRTALQNDPAQALGGYDLTAADIELLATQLDDAGGDHSVEERTSKSALLGLLTQLTGGGGGGAGKDALQPKGRAGGIGDDPGSIRGFNPQPEPPGAPARGGGPIEDPGSIRGFNPQPEPPGAPMDEVGIRDPGDSAINIDEIAIDDAGIAE